MADISSVWGIDIGQAGLKAIHLRYAEAAGQVLAAGFDYIPHPKILSQPDAIPAELIAEAMQTFLSRNQNELKGSLVGISTPGNTSIVKFVQLPPVEAAKVADIVKFEAKQQIPFPLEDVVWDWQTMGSGVEESGYMLNAEVGIVAMKKDQVQQALKPFTDNKIEIDLIQTSQLALFNFMCYDQFGMRPGEGGEQDGYTILLDMGADSTMMLASNGSRLWVRNISIGGNQFTRALTKEMKLTFAKAEHLKCNATKAPDPKAVFQALRPVFNDYVSEIQRSIGFFSSVNRDAQIKKILAVGNGFKLAGLQKFLQQNLQYEVERVETFGSMVGDMVTAQPLFQENTMAFAVPYGIALQLLNLTAARLSLLPQEIKTARMIRRKKPWAVAAAATLLAGFSLSTMGYALSASTVTVDRWKTAEGKVTEVAGMASNLKGEFDKAEKENKDLREKGNFLVKRAEGRRHWMEVYKAINASLPQDDNTTADLGVGKRRKIRLYSITCKLEQDAEAWFKSVTSQAPSMLNYLDPADKATAPAKGPAYVFTLKGLHYNDAMGDFVPKTLIKNLQQWRVAVRPDSPETVPVRQLGITHVMQVFDLPHQVDYYPNGMPTNGTGGAVMGGFAGSGGMRSPMGPMGPGVGPMGPGAGGAPGFGARRQPMGPGATSAGNTGVNNFPVEKIWQTDFELVFLWRETPEEQRPVEDPRVAATQGAAPGAPGANPGANPPATPPGMQPATPPGMQPATPPGAAAPGLPVTSPPTAVPAGTPADPGAAGAVPPGTPGAVPPGAPGAVPPGAPGAVPPGTPPGAGPATPPGTPPGTPM